MTNKKVYIAGKITGDPNYHDKFQKAKDELEREGFIVISPAVLSEGMKPADYMRICLAMIDSADIVAFLPDWSSSNGANLEMDWCVYTGKPTMMLPLKMSWTEIQAARVQMREADHAE